MDGNKKKDTVTVKEIEEFTRKYKIEVFFCLSFILACFFSFVFFGTGWGIVLATTGGVIGVVMPGKIEFLFKKMFQFFFKQEQTIQIVLAVVSLIISIFLPPLIFLKLGLYGGKSLYHFAMEIAHQHHH